MYKIFCCFSMIAFAFLAGCSTPKPTSLLSESAYSLSSSEPINRPQYNQRPLPVSIPQHHNQFRGVISRADNFQNITLCQTNESLPLKAHGKLTKQLNLRNKDSIYIEFEGTIQNSNLVANVHNAELSIAQLHYLSSNTMNKCLFTQAPARFEIKGTKPHWVGHALGNKFNFKIKELDTQWDIEESTITKGVTGQITTRNSQGEPLFINLSGQGCLDEKQDYWQYKAIISIKDKVVEGCGKYPNTNDEKNWQGKYQYQNANVAIEVQLDKNMKASVIYNYLDGKQIFETGYWHLFGSSGLKLLLTHRQGIAIDKEFHFTREGSQLYASSQWRNNTKYTFEGGRLTLTPIAKEVFSPEIAQSPALREFSPVSMSSPDTASPAINQAIKRYFKMHKSPYKGSKYLYGEYDLNGNGDKELLVLLDWCQASGCVLLVFENTGERYRFISRIAQVQTPIEVSRKQSNTWQSLLLKNGQQWRLVDFDGISYPSDSSLGVKPQKTDFTGVKLINNSLNDNWGININ